MLMSTLCLNRLAGHVKQVRTITANLESMRCDGILQSMALTNETRDVGQEPAALTDDTENVGHEPAAELVVYVQLGLADVVPQP